MARPGGWRLGGVPAAAAAEQSPVLAATVHVARHTARPLPKHRAGVGPESLTETSARGRPRESTFTAALLSFYGRSLGMGVGGRRQVGFSLSSLQHSPVGKENLLEQDSSLLGQRRAGLVPPRARLSDH